MGLQQAGTLRGYAVRCQSGSIVGIAGKMASWNKMRKFLVLESTRAVVEHVLLHFRGNVTWSKRHCWYSCLQLVELLSRRYSIACYFLVGVGIAKFIMRMYMAFKVTINVRESDKTRESALFEQSRTGRLGPFESKLDVQVSAEYLSVWLAWYFAIASAHPSPAIL